MNDLKLTALKLTAQPMEFKAREPLSIKKESAVIDEIDKEKMRLKKASREFESFFMQSMLKSMRATLPKTDESDDAPGGGFGKEIFESMFDQELSKKMAENSRGGLGDMLYKKLLPRLEARFGIESNVTMGKVKTLPISESVHNETRNAVNVSSKSQNKE